MKMLFEKETANEIKHSVKTTSHCHNICVETIRYCLIEGGPYSESANIRNLQDCAEICRLNVDMMLRDSDYEAPIANLCAEICDNCADSTGRFSDDEKMLECSNICRECAIACRDMIDSQHRES